MSSAYAQLPDASERAIPLESFVADEPDGDDTSSLLSDDLERSVHGEGYPPDKHAEVDDEDAAAIVRRVVPETPDDPTLPTLTVRVLVCGSILACIGSAVSQLLFFKSNSVSLGAFLIILVSLPMGRAMARYLPSRMIRLPGGFSFDLNPGPFNLKEHILLVVLAGSGTSVAYGADIIAIQDLFYKVDIGPIGGILLLLTTQMIGFGLSGLVYDVLVRPTAMLWPSTLVILTLLDTLHRGKGARQDGRASLTAQRLRFFSIAFLAMFAWQFLPAIWAPTLTSIATLCFFGQTKTLRTLGSGYSGFGLGNLSLDWSVVGSTGSLYTPFYASMNIYAGLLFCTIIWGPLIYFGNVWEAQSFDSPLGAHLYNRTFQPFDIKTILTADLELDQVAFAAVQPVLLTPFFAFTYGLSFAVLTAAVVTVLLWNFNTVRSAFSKRRAPADVHVRVLEQNYAAVPGSWYASIGGSMMAAAIVMVSIYPLQTPIWALCLSVFMGLVFLLPCGVIAATTNTVIGLNVGTELIAGYLMPGKPIGNVVFKALGYMTLAQALGLLSDLKLGLYARVPPRHMFICQAWGTALGATVNLLFVKAVIESKRPYLDGTLEDPSGQWTGRAPNIFMSASVICKYRSLYWGFAIGAVLPIIPWWIHRRRPALGKRLHLDKVSVPLFIDGMIKLPQTPSNLVISGLTAAYVGQRWALRRYPEWHRKYMYVLSAAFDSATSVNALVVFLFGLASLAGPSWWNSSIDSEHCKPGS